MHRRERLAEIDAHQRRFAGAEGPAFVQLLVERFPLEQLHPDPGDAVEDVRAEHGDDIGVPDARQPPSFGDHAVHSGGIRGRNELQRDVAIEFGITSAIDGAEGAAAEHAADLERPPAAARFERRPRDGVFVDGVAAPVQIGERREDLEFAEKGARVTPLGVDGLPRNRPSIRDGGGDFVETVVLQRHSGVNHTRARRPARQPGARLLPASRFAGEAGGDRRFGLRRLLVPGGRCDLLLERGRIGQARQLVDEHERVLGGDVELAAADLAGDLIVDPQQIVAQLGELRLVGVVGA